MVRRSASFFPAWLLIGFLSLTPGLPADPVETTGSDHARVRLRTETLRIEPRRDATPGDCLDLGLDDLVVKLRGERVDRSRLVELERGNHEDGIARPALHALLVDTSYSMVGRLEQTRSAALEYLELLDLSRDSALIATFDESLLMLQPATRNRERLEEAIGRIHIGGNTSMNDGLHYLMRELQAHPERPVLILLTDGVDTGSLHERHDVRELAATVPELTVFTIGVGLPFLGDAGPPGIMSIKRFLHNLAGRYNGAFFDVPTSSRLGRDLLRVREMLDNEARLTLVDPDPQAERGRISVTSSNPSCKIHLFRQSDASSSGGAFVGPIEEPSLPVRMPFDPSKLFLDHHINRLSHRLEADCRRREDENLPDWFVRVETDAIRGCALDVTMDQGRLYDLNSSSRADSHGIPLVTTKPIEVALNPPDQLPCGPEALLPGLAQIAGTAEESPRINWRKRPRKDHARPFHDIPSLYNGNAFLDQRSRLARAIYQHPAYRDWVSKKLDEETQQELDEIRGRFRRLAPGLTDSVLEEVVQGSEQGLAALLRAAAPTDVDLQRHLAAWLGDIHASELFLRWESNRIDELIHETGDGSFHGDWHALRKLFFVPSYARVLTLLSPVHDVERDRIGFWRVVLPRVSWIQPRVKGAKRHPDLSILPMDLLPDEPHGVQWVQRSLARHPELARHLRDRDYSLDSMRYELTGKPYRQDPRRAFRDFRLTLLLTNAAGGRMEIRTDYHQERQDPLALPVGLSASVVGDLRLRGLAAVLTPTSVAP